jgi:hypothetical protein
MGNTPLTPAQLAQLRKHDTPTLLHGDCNGVTTIPHAIAGQIADACDAFMRAEAVIMSYLRAGAPTLAGMGAARARPVGCPRIPGICA